MPFLNHLRLTPIACTIFTSSLLLTRLSISPDSKTLAAKSAPKVSALVDIGKWVKSVPHEKYRDETRDWFVDRAGMAWQALRSSQAAALNIVRAQRDGRGWLIKNLHAEYNGDSDILRIWLSDGSLQEQAAIVNTIVRGFLQYTERSQKQHLKENIASCQTTLALYKRLGDDADIGLRSLNGAVPHNLEQAWSLWNRRNSLARNLALGKRGVLTNRLGVEENEAALGTLPRIVKWADSPKPEE